MKSQDERQRKIVKRTSGYADRNGHQEHSVKEYVSGLLISAGAENQGAAGREGAEGTGLDAENGAGKECCGV